MLKIKKIVAVILLFFLVQPVYLDCILQPTRIYKLGRYVLMGGRSIMLEDVLKRVR